MFEQTFVDGLVKTNKPWTVCVSFAGQLAAVGVMILLPLVFTEQVKLAQLTSIFLAPSVPPGPPPPQSEMPPAKATKVIPRQFTDKGLIQPKQIPKDIALIRDEELPPPASAASVVGSIPGGIGESAGGGFLASLLDSLPSPAPQAPVAPVKAEPEKPRVQRIPVGGQLQNAKLIRAPKPVYPPLARQARIQGVVHLKAIIGTDGTIQNLTSEGGHPLLVPAAIEAVRQWLYQPTLLNGVPVEVVTVIDVNFTLSQ